MFRKGGLPKRICSSSVELVKVRISFVLYRLFKTRSVFHSFTFLFQSLRPLYTPIILLDEDSSPSLVLPSKRLIPVLVEFLPIQRTSFHCLINLTFGRVNRSRPLSILYSTSIFTFQVYSFCVLSTPFLIPLRPFPLKSSSLRLVTPLLDKKLSTNF